jgi:hypothetical protein
VSLWNFLENTLLLYIPLLTLTDRQNDRQRLNREGAKPLEGRVARLILLVVVSVCVVFCVLCCLQNNPVFLSVTISHILKNENYELCFLVGFYLCRSNYDRKKGTVVWPLVGINLRSPSVVSKYKHHQSHFNLRKFLLGFFILQK